MSLPHAILGLLQIAPMTGYELKTRHFEKSIAHFWPADQTQIYRTLDRLVEQGWAATHEEIQHNRPNRKLYTLTESGHAELRRWLTTPQPLPTFREPLLIQVFFAAQLLNEEIISLLEEQLAEHRERLASYQRIDLPLLGVPSASREKILQRLTLEMGLRREQAYIEWLEQAIDIIHSLKEEGVPKAEIRKKL